MTSDELADYERNVDHDELLVAELADERELSDADELADVDAEPDSTFFDRTRLAYSGCSVDGNGDDIDVRELKSAGALLDDPAVDADADGDDD